MFSKIVITSVACAALAFAGEPIAPAHQAGIAKKMLALQAAQSRALNLKAQITQMQADLARASAEFDTLVEEYKKAVEALRKEEGRGDSCTPNLSLEWECASPATASK